MEKHVKTNNSDRKNIIYVSENNSRNTTTNIRICNLWKNMAFTHAHNLFMKTQHFKQHFMQHFNILVGFKSLLEKF